MYDAIVVGGRVAGAPSAMLLAAKGYRVLVVDRDTFPSDIMSTHYIHQDGVAHLQRWGLLDEIIASNCPPIQEFRLDLGGTVIQGEAPPVDGAEFALCPRRRFLDSILLRAAARAGAEVREGFSVQEIIVEGDRVTGIRGHGKGGTDLTEQARIVIGADGMRSLVARAVQAPEYNQVPGSTCGYYGYWSGLSFPEARLYNRGTRLLYSFPTNDGLTCLAQEWPKAEFQEFRSDIEGNFNRQYALTPDFEEQFRGAKREERFEGMTDLPNFFRKPYGPGWALVGDAGYHKDPVTGRGISDAFRDAALLATAIDDGFSERRPLEEALAGYEHKRNQASMPMYELTLQQVSFQPPPPEMEMLLPAIAASPEATSQFLGLLAGATKADEFFAPGNIGKIIAAAQARATAAG